MRDFAIEIDPYQLAQVNRILDRLRRAGADPKDLLHAIGFAVKNRTRARTTQGGQA